MYVCMYVCYFNTLIDYTSHQVSLASSIYFSIILAQASCVFNGSIWVTGGKTAKYTQYNLMDAYSIADVWKSPDGGELIFYCFSYIMMMITRRFWIIIINYKYDSN